METKIGQNDFVNIDLKNVFYVLYMFKNVFLCFFIITCFFVKKHAHTNYKYTAFLTGKRNLFFSVYHSVLYVLFNNRLMFSHLVDIDYN